MDSRALSAPENASDRTRVALVFMPRLGEVAAWYLSGCDGWFLYGANVARAEWMIGVNWYRYVITYQIVFLHRV